MHSERRIEGHLRRLALAALLLVPSLWVSTELHFCFDFFYPLWYDALRIEATIAEHAPHNVYRQGFQQTSRQERFRLFSAIVRGIATHGEGLEQLSYTGADGRPIDTFLIRPEVDHLRAVARLVRTLRQVGLVSSLVGFLLLLKRLRMGLPVPGLAAAARPMIMVYMLLTLPLLLLGPDRAFRLLHVAAFPLGHMWNFPYNVSLMTTLMKAPVIFAPIAVSIILGSVLLQGIAYAFWRWLSVRVTASALPRVTPGPERRESA